MIDKKQLQDIVKSSDNAVDFYMQAYSIYGEEIKTFFQEKGISYKEYYEELLNAQETPTKSEWEEPKGSIEDWFKLGSLRIDIKSFKVVPTKRKHITASAMHLGVIEVNKDNYFSKQVFDHEIGHQLTNGNTKLQQAVIMNYGNILGRFNNRLMKFDGVFGEYNPDEAFATCYSRYINYPSKFKSLYPDTYKVIDKIVKSISNLKEIQKGFYDAYYDCYHEELNEGHTYREFPIIREHKERTIIMSDILESLRK